MSCLISFKNIVSLLFLAWRRNVSSQHFTKAIVELTELLHFQSWGLLHWCHLQNWTGCLWLVSERRCGWTLEPTEYRLWESMWNSGQKRFVVKRAFCSSYLVMDVWVKNVVWGCKFSFWTVVLPEFEVVKYTEKISEASCSVFCPAIKFSESS